jgi:hypothetical protein
MRPGFRLHVSRLRVCLQVFLLQLYLCGVHPHCLSGTGWHLCYAKAWLGVVRVPVVDCDLGGAIKECCIV